MVWGLPETMVTPGCPLFLPGKGAMSYWKAPLISFLIAEWDAAARTRKTARPCPNGFSAPPKAVFTALGMMSLRLYHWYTKLWASSDWGESSVYFIASKSAHLPPKVHTIMPLPSLMDQASMRTP